MHPTTKRPAGFTLVEMMIVVGIIILLIGILVPVISKVKTSSYVATTQARMSSIQAAIEGYYQDFHAYPGPLTYLQVQATPPLLPPQIVSANGTFPLTISQVPYALANTTQITMSENLVLGLLGGLSLTYNNAGNVTGFVYNPELVGKGPRTLNTAISIPKTYQPYLEIKPGYLSNYPNSVNSPYLPGSSFKDGSGTAMDSEIPEFVDAFPSPLPILYMRARVGATVNPPYSGSNNPVATNDVAGTANPPRPGQYDLSQIIAYTSSTTNNAIGDGKDSSVKSAYNGPLQFPQHGLQSVTVSSTPLTLATQYPYDFCALLTSPNGVPVISNPTAGSTPPVPRQKDGYILISAGKDRIYGTDDDICSFGSIAP